MKKLLIIGHARHGKDTVAEYLRELFGYNFESSSQAASRIFLYEALKGKYGYQSPEECFEDRVNHRQEWHDLICAYNAIDPVRLAKDILKTSNVYVGMRSDREVEAAIEQRIFDYVIGVYDYRKPEEDKDSFNINMWEKADIIIPNSSTLQKLKERVNMLKPFLLS
jgi:hypothetical protein